MFPVRFDGRLGLGLLDRLDREFGCVPGWAGFDNRYRVDAREDEDHYYIDVEVPGVSKDDIEVTLENGVLTIAGEKKASSGAREATWHVRERRFGRFSRSFTVPDDVDEEKVAASLANGVLTITLDKREESKPRRIAVNGGHNGKGA